MKRHLVGSLRLAAFITLAGLLFNLPALAAPNIYTNTTSGKWEVSSNWSLGAPRATDSSYITNAALTAPITVTIDATTSSGFTNTMTVANLNISSLGNDYSNTLFLNSAGISTSLHVISNLTVLPGGALTLFNSALRVDNGTTPTNTDLGSEVEFDGNQVLAVNSTIDTSHAMYTTVGGSIFGGGGAGNLSMSNSTFTPHNFYVGYLFNGTATFLNCSNVFGYGLTMGGAALAVGNMSFIGGTWIATNTYAGPDSPLINLGVNGTGNLTISNASVQFGATAIGNSGAGSLIVQSNVVMTLGKTFLGLADPHSSGTFSIDGAQVSLPELHIVQGTGMVNMANGTLTVPIVSIGETNTAAGAFNITGGTTFISTSLTARSNSLAGAGVSVSGGALNITNATHTATTIMNGGSLHVGAGAFQTDNLILTNGGSITSISNFLVGTTAGTTNTIDLSGGSTLILTNATLGLGNNGPTNSAGIGIAFITGATVNVTTLNLGSTAGGLGLLTLQSNALVNIQSNLTVVSDSLVATSSITFDGGSFTASNGLTQIGSSGNGLLTISAGNHTFRQITLGSTNGLGSGGFHFLGGHVTLLGTGTGPGHGLNSNWILWEGGDLDGSGTCLTVADGNDSNVSIPAYAFNVRGQLDSMYVGYSAGNIGTFTQAASSSVVVITDQMILGNGDCVSGAQGDVILSGGTLYVTNATHTANLDVRNGTFTLGPGATLVVDNLILTNACGHFIKQPGGILITNNAPRLSPNLDADGDGQSNAAEALAGTDPLNPSSFAFQITSVVKTNGNSIRVDWTTVGGHSYVVQTNGNLASGTFSDLSLPIAVPGTAEGTTNYVHTDGATNSTRFYRVRLGP